MKDEEFSWTIVVFNSIAVLLVAFVISYLMACFTAPSAKKDGEFNSKSTAKEVCDYYAKGGKLMEGKTIIITGGNSGIGLECVKALCSIGAKVILCSRSIENGEKAVREEVEQLGHGGYKVENASKNIEIKQLDLEDLTSIERFAGDIITSEARIDGLILNAGIMAVPNLEYTKSGFERQIGVNHMGHFYLFKLLEQKMLSQKIPSRIIVLSSYFHKYGSIDGNDMHYKKGRSYSGWGSYGQSKLANLLFAKSLADRNKERGAGSEITSVSVHPGIISTGLHKNLGPFGRFIYDWFASDKNIPQGASSTIYAMLCPQLTAEVHAGAYISDCKVAQPLCDAAVDLQGENRKLLWDASEKSLAQALAGKEVE